MPGTVRDVVLPLFALVTLEARSIEQGLPCSARSDSSLTPIAFRRLLKSWPRPAAVVPRVHDCGVLRFVLERNCHFGGQLSGAERLGLRRCRLGRTIDGERHLSRVRRMFGIGVRRRRPGRVGGGGRRRRDIRSSD